MSVLAGTNARRPASDPMRTVLVSAAYAGLPTVATAAPPRMPAARDIAWRRSQRLFDTTRVLTLLLNSSQFRLSRAESFMLSLMAPTRGDARCPRTPWERARQFMPVGHLVPGRRGKSSRSPCSLTTSRSRCATFCAAAVPATAKRARAVLKIMLDGAGRYSAAEGFDY